jgi:hypothetical protein
MQSNHYALLSEGFFLPHIKLSLNTRCCKILPLLSHSDIVEKQLVAQEIFSEVCGLSLMYASA